MAQGWKIDNVAHTITFKEPPPTGTGNVVIKEFATGAVGGTDCWAEGAWSQYRGFPTEVEFFSDRMVWASTLADPQLVWASNTGDYSNMGKSSPIVDSDGFSFAINTRQVNAVMDLVPLDKLIVLAKGGEFLMTGGQDEVVTPSTVDIKPQSYHGTGIVQAKVVGDTAVFVKEQGQHILDIGYRFEQDGYRPNDLSVWADHLVDGYAINRLEWMPAPYRVIPAVRNDGVMIGCTYMPEQDIIGWHRHQTDGEILDVACLPGQKQTELHVLVRRKVNGEDRVYLEQLADFSVGDIRDWCYVDSALTYDGRNTGSTTVKLTSTTTWDETGALTLTASAALFVGADDVGDGFAIDAGNGETLRVVITDYMSATQVKVVSVGTVPPSLRAIPTTAWVLQRNTISGLDHLEGRTVSILSDASVHQQRVVTGGTITLSSPGGVVQVGLPYRAMLETLEVNAPGGEPIRGSKKLIQSVGLLLNDSRGIKAGSNLDYLDVLAQREFENYGDPTLPLTGYGTIPVSSEWGTDSGHVYIVSDDPLPCEILAITPRLMVGDAG